MYIGVVYLLRRDACTGVWYLRRRIVIHFSQCVEHMYYFAVWSK
jgi:hypothetical protein